MHIVSMIQGQYQDKRMIIQRYLYYRDIGGRGAPLPLVGKGQPIAIGGEGILVAYCKGIIRILHGYFHDLIVSS